MLIQTNFEKDNLVYARGLLFHNISGMKLLRAQYFQYLHLKNLNRCCNFLYKPISSQLSTLYCIFLTVKFIAERFVKKKCAWIKAQQSIFCVKTSKNKIWQQRNLFYNFAITATVIFLDMLKRRKA
jgi:hypothetical protein